MTNYQAQYRKVDLIKSIDFILQKCFVIGMQFMFAGFFLDILRIEKR